MQHFEITSIYIVEPCFGELLAVDQLLVKILWQNISIGQFVQEYFYLLVVYSFGFRMADRHGSELFSMEGHIHRIGHLNNKIRPVIRVLGPFAILFIPEESLER